MNHQHHERRAGRARVLAVAVMVVLVAATCAALVTAAGASAGGPAATQSILTLRTDGDSEGLWTVTPAGVATRVGTLPGLAGTAAVSPDGSMVAYTPEKGASLWLWEGPGAPKTISLQSAGISGVWGSTWIASDTLMISASKGGTRYNARTALLFTVDVGTGSVAPFRSLRGTSPNADIASGKMVYVRFKKLDNGSAKNDHTPLYRESMMLLDLKGTSAPVELDSREYRIFYDGGEFASPQLAPGADWIVTGAVSNDPEGTYKVYGGSAISSLWLTMFEEGPHATAWSPVGGKLALCSMLETPGVLEPPACVYVLDVDSGAMTRTPAGLFDGVAPGWLGGVAWANDGSLVVDALDSNVPGHMGKVLLVGSGLDTVKDLGEGHLSVWVL